MQEINLDFIKKRLNKTVTTLAVVVFCALLFVVFANIGTSFHEYAFHNLAARMMGCQAESGVSIFTGITTFDCPNITPLMAIIIALVAPVGCFFLGMGLWYTNKDGLLRVLGAVMCFYSSIPSLLPILTASDMAFAIRQGFNVYAGWAIFILLAGWFFAELTLEIMDKKVFGDKFP